MKCFRSHDCYLCPQKTFPRKIESLHTLIQKVEAEYEPQHVCLQFQASSQTNTAMGNALRNPCWTPWAILSFLSCRLWTTSERSWATSSRRSQSLRGSRESSLILGRLKVSSYLLKVGFTLHKSIFFSLCTSCGRRIICIYIYIWHFYHDIHIYIYYMFKKNIWMYMHIDQFIVRDCYSRIVAQKIDRVQRLFLHLGASQR